MDKVLQNGNRLQPSINYMVEEIGDRLQRQVVGLVTYCSDSWKWQVTDALNVTNTKCNKIRNVTMNNVSQITKWYKVLNVDIGL